MECVAGSGSRRSSVILGARIPIFRFLTGWNEANTYVRIMLCGTIWDYRLHHRCTNRVHLAARATKFLRWRLIFVGSQYGTCFVLSLCCLESWAIPLIFRTFVRPWLLLSAVTNCFSNSASPPNFGAEWLINVTFVGTVLGFVFFVSLLGPMFILCWIYNWPFHRQQWHP
jgi:hypothetical protein